MIVKSLLFPCLCVLALFCTEVSLPAQTTQPTATTTKKSSKKSHSRKKRVRGQQKMDPQRVREIQGALVREHYLEKASGQWDVTTQNAMQRYQEDNGWQSKVLPDSRALIKLGLGPDHDHLLNPESAMTSMSGTAPPPASAETPAADSKKQ
jgi:hypothetical protein